MPRGSLIIHSPLVVTGSPPVPVGVMPAATVAPARAVVPMIALINAPIIEVGAVLTKQISVHLVLVGKALVKDVGLHQL